MNKAILLLALSFTFISSCTSMYSQSKGIESEGYLIFIGNPDNYTNGIQVMVGDDIQFDAFVFAENDRKANDTLYAIPTGSHEVVIYYQGIKILEKLIFISTKETKPIYL